jgi:hypothetical protein
VGPVSQHEASAPESSAKQLTHGEVFDVGETPVGSVQPIASLNCW